MNTRKLIFVVDDDPVISTLIVRRFESEGYKVDAFRYGEDCIKELDRNPDLIILDYFFVDGDNEVMNGLEIFDEIKISKPDTPVIMLSGQERGEIVLELARKGIDDYVIKDNNIIDNLLVATKDLLGRV
jgi:CheY-like chemotaxis protein